MEDTKLPENILRVSTNNWRQYMYKQVIYVRSDTYKLDQLFVNIVTKSGISNSFIIECNFRIICHFETRTDQDMIPQYKVYVYSIRDGKMLHGESTITAYDIGANTLKYDGHDIKKEDVLNKLNKIYKTLNTFVINLTSWHDCNSEELERIHRGRIYVVPHHNYILEANDLNGELEIDNNNDEEVPVCQFDEDEDEALVAPPISEKFIENALIYDEFQYGVPGRDLSYNTYWGSEITRSVGNYTKDFRSLNSNNNWMISGFSIHKDYGLAFSEPRELKVKSNFYTKLYLPYSIKHDEILRLDVKVFIVKDYNRNMNATVILHNLRGKEFEFVEYVDSIPTFHSNSSDSKTIKLQSGVVKNASFYIRSISENSLRNIIRIRVDTVINNDGTSLHDKILKKLRINPVGVKTYKVSSKSFSLNSSSRQQTHSTQLMEPGLDYYSSARMSISGKYLTITRKYSYQNSDSLEQSTSTMKTNAEKFRYLKKINATLSTEVFHHDYQSILEQKSRNWNYRNTTGYIACFVDTIASAMEVEAIPTDIQMIEKELDVLKASQTMNGSFDNFGNFPEFRGESKSAQYFQTAFILVPFLKFREFTFKSYDDVIEKGFRYLNGIENLEILEKDALSVAAYAFALHNDIVEAQKLLEVVEGDVIKNKTEKCYKLERSSASCDLRHTSYTANAYLTLNDVNKARPALAWLLQTYNINKYYSNTHAHAIATEAIAKFLSTLKLNKTSKFTVNIRNDGGFNKNVLVNKNNSAEPIEFSVPDYSLMVNTSVSGIGYCSITTVVERTLSNRQINTRFNLSVATLQTSISSEEIVQICVTFKPLEEHIKSLFNVIYDVEFPSGYRYLETLNADNYPELKLIVEKQSFSRVIAYFNDFVKDKNYCLDFKVKKLIEVKNSQLAGVKVYDSNEQENAAVEFYSFNSDQI